MWISSLCKLCLIYSRVKDLITLGREDAIPELLVCLAGIVRKESSRSRAFAEAFNIIKLLINNNDPYIETKIKLNEIGKKIYTNVEKYLEEKVWNLREAFRISAAANIIDTSVLGYEAKNLQEAIWDKPFIEEIPKIPKDRDIYVVLDNAGEAVIDTLLVKALKIHGYNVYAVVRKESYEIDVLRNDVHSLDIIETPGNLSPVFYIDKGFVIAKGIANAEAYVESGKVPSIHLLRAKCDVIAKTFGTPKNSVIIVSGETLKNML